MVLPPNRPRAARGSDASRHRLLAYRIADARAVSINFDEIFHIGSWASRLNRMFHNFSPAAG
jgi:hypothetical protein